MVQKYIGSHWYKLKISTPTELFFWLWTDGEGPIALKMSQYDILGMQRVVNQLHIPKTRWLNENAFQQVAMPANNILFFLQIEWAEDLLVLLSGLIKTPFHV